MRMVIGVINKWCSGLLGDYMGIRMREGVAWGGCTRYYKGVVWWRCVGVSSTHCLELPRHSYLMIMLPLQMGSEPHHITNY